MPPASMLAKLEALEEPAAHTTALLEQGEIARPCTAGLQACAHKAITVCLLKIGEV